MTMRWYTKSEAVLMAVGGVIGAAWGALPMTAQVCFCMIGLDVVAGLVRSAAQKRWASDVCRSGMLKKAAIMLLVASAVVVQRCLPSDLPLAGMTSGAFAIAEFMSIVENAAVIGVPIPKAVRDILNIARKEFEKEEMENG